MGNDAPTADQIREPNQDGDEADHPARAGLKGAARYGKPGDVSTAAERTE